MKRVKYRHSFYNFILRPAGLFIARILFGYRKNEKYHIKKHENVFVLCNHQTDLDPIFLGLSFNKPLYYVCTDSVFSNKFTGALVKHIFNPIPKKKGISDPLCIKNIMRTIKEKGSVALFAEGNRSYAEFQYYIEPGLAKLIKTLKTTLVIYNLKGGFGVSPRFANKKRKGKYTGVIKKVLTSEQISNLSDEELLNIIIDSLKVYDSESNNLYKSNRKAEYLERMLFVCPKCNKMQTLHSSKNSIKCINCNLEVNYNENLHLSSNDKSFKFDILNDWYQYQKKYIKEMNIEDNEVIFEDKNVRLYISNVYEPRKLIAKGKLILTKNYLSINDFKVDICNIKIASPLSGTKFNFSTENENYLIKGSPRFNPLKYVLMFNKLDTKMKNIDKYYSLD